MWVIKRTPSSIYVRDDAGTYWKSEYTPIIDWGPHLDPVHPQIFDYVFVPYEKPDAVFLGMPFGDRSRWPNSTVGTFPQLIRKASLAFTSTNTFPDNSAITLYDVDRTAIRNCGRVWDIGDIAERSDATLSSVIDELVPRDIPVVIVGGDHACTYDFAVGLGHILATPLTIWHFDAHFDRYSLPSGDPRVDHGNFISHLERTGMFRVIHIGVRGLRGHTQMVGAPFRSLPSSQFSLERFRQLVDAVPASTSYLSIDMDCLDPSDFPLVDFPIPNGLAGTSVEEAVRYLFQSHHQVVAADIVEANADGNAERGDYGWAVRILVAILEGLALQGHEEPSGIKKE